MERPRNDEPTDEELVRRIVRPGAGEESGNAADVLFGRYLDRVFGWCQRHVRDRDRALDLAQEVLTSAWRALDRFDGRVPFGGWLYVITRNRCYRALRPVSLWRDEDVVLEEVADAEPGPAEQLAERDSADRMLELMRSELDPVEQDALWLRCYERLPVEEITRILKLTTASGARGVLQSARRKLRAAMARRGIVP
jgi:RNA polymerase sigma factor (sigma-70 family)